MPHKLYRLLDGVLNTPQLVTVAAFRPIVDYLQSRSESPSFMIQPLPTDPDNDGDNDADSDEDTDNDAIGEICIDGVLTYKPVMGMCGPSGVSYQGILEQAADLIASGVSAIVMTHSSPGGEASHTFTTAQELRAMCDAANVKLITYIDTQSQSAALALGVVADEVYIHPSAYTGSIGCVCALMDQSKAMANAGIKPIFIASTAGKTGFAEDGSFTPEFLAEVQAQVTDLGNQFAQHVSTYTGIPVEDILAMDAKTFNATDAVAVGLANGVMDHPQFAAYLEQLQ